MRKERLLILFALAFTSCHPIFCVWNMGFNRVQAIAENQVVGKYELTARSKKMMKYEGNYNNIPNSILELNANNTYRLIDAPDWLTDFGISNKGYFDKTDRWDLSCEKEGCILELEGLETGELLVKKNDKLFILLDIGDPDNCRGLVYEKQ